MTTVRELHRQAMSYVDDAYVDRMEGDNERSREMYRLALPLEEEAARMVPKRQESEPTRSILYLSAASIALQAGEFAKAEELAVEGITGYPSGRILADLNAVVREAALNGSRTR